MVDNGFGGHILFISDQWLKLRERHGDHAVIHGACQQPFGVDVLLQKGANAGGINAAVFQRGFDVLLERRKGIEIDLTVDDLQKAFILFGEQVVIGHGLPEFRRTVAIALRQQCGLMAPMETPQMTSKR